MGRNRKGEIQFTILCDRNCDKVPLKRQAIPKGTKRPPSNFDKIKELYGQDF